MASSITGSGGARVAPRRRPRRLRESSKREQALRATDEPSWIMRVARTEAARGTPKRLANRVLPSDAALPRVALARMANSMGGSACMGLRISRNPETRGARRIERPLHVVLDLRRIAPPQRRQRRHRISVAPIDAQVDNRPLHFAHDEKGRRMHGSGFSAGGESGPHTFEETVAQMSASGLERAHA